MAAAPETVWAALPGALERAFDRPGAQHLARLLGCEDENGFGVTRADPPRVLVLEGRHRFSRYRLAFEIEPAVGGARLRAVTHAEFPGFHGGIYRALVIGTGGHRMATRRLLRSIARYAERGGTSIPSMAKETT